MEESRPKTRLLDRITPKILLEVKHVFKTSGVKGVTKRFGWKVFAAFFMYYLVRDVSLYILLPLYLAGKLF